MVMDSVNQTTQVIVWDRGRPSKSLDGYAAMPCRR